jgi:hypothetical protein
MAVCAARRANPRMPRTSLPALLLLAGCATMAPEPRVQTIDVRVEADHPLPLLDCTAANDLGRWSFAAPGPVVVQVSRRPLTLACDLPTPGVARTRSDARDAERTGQQAGATIGATLGVAAGAVAAPIAGPVLAVMLVLGGAAQGAQIGGLVGWVAGGPPAYPPVIVVKVVPAP